MLHSSALHTSPLHTSPKNSNPSSVGPRVLGLACAVFLVVGVITSIGVGDDQADRPRPIPADTLPKDLHDRPVPLGLDGEGTVASSSELSKKQFDLGRALFFDPILSEDRTVACATCHRPDHGFSSPDARPVGIRGARADRNAPSLFNRGYGTLQSWDGRAETLEKQSLLPISHPKEMGLPLAEAVDRLRRDERYDREFIAAFDEGLTSTNIGVALAAFMRRLYSGGTSVDLFVAAKDSNLSESAKTGLWLYESKGKCWKCHSGRNFTDEQFHNTGVGVRDGKPEPGRYALTNRDSDRGAFKTPTLRGVALNPPYMHDGSLATLRDVVEFYRQGGHPNSHLDPKVEPLDLSDQEVEDLVAFLEALSRPASK